MENWNCDYAATIIPRCKIQTMESLSKGICRYQEEHLVKTNKNSSISIVLFLYSTTTTGKIVEDLIGPYYEYIVSCHIFQLSIYFFTSQKDCWHLNLLVGDFIIVLIATEATSAWASLNMISRKLLPKTLHLLGSTTRYCLFRFWTCWNEFLFFMFFLLFSGIMDMYILIGYTVMHNEYS